MPFAGSVHRCFSFAPREISPQKPTIPNSTSATNGRRRTTMWKCDRIFIHIHIHFIHFFFFFFTHKPIPVDMRKRIQDEYNDLYILHGCVFFVIYTCCFCILVFFLHGTVIKIIIIFKKIMIY